MVKFQICSQYKLESSFLFYKIQTSNTKKICEYVIPIWRYGLPWHKVGGCSRGERIVVK